MTERNSITFEAIQSMMHRAIEKFNSQASHEQKLSKDFDAPLFGQSGKLDSLGLVNFIILVEEEISLLSGSSVSLANEKAMSKNNSPFSTINRLQDFIIELLDDCNT